MIIVHTYCSLDACLSDEREKKFGQLPPMLFINNLLGLYIYIDVNYESVCFFVHSPQATIGTI